MERVGMTRRAFGRVRTGRRDTDVPNGETPIKTEFPHFKRIIKEESYTTPSLLQPNLPPLPQPSQVVEYTVRVPKVIGVGVGSKCSRSLMRFNGALGVDFSTWSSARLAREDNSALHRPLGAGVGREEMPKYGAGSEYGREEREEARRRKWGALRKKYNPGDQPWILKATTPSSTKKFKGVREGGVSENASYFIFTQGQEGYFEVFSIKDWYNFTPIQRYKALSAEEAEEKFSKRNKILNLGMVMVHKRLRDGREEESGGGGGDGPDGPKSHGKNSDDGGGGGRSEEMRVTDMDDWVDEEEEELSEEEEENTTRGKKGKGKAKAPTKTKGGATKGKGGRKRRGKKDESGEDEEDSDDGDGEGREQDYSTDVSTEIDESDEEDKKNGLRGIDEDEGMRALWDSDATTEEDTGAKSEGEGEEGDEEEGEEGGVKKEGGGVKKEEGGGGGKKSKKKKKKSKGGDGGRELPNLFPSPNPSNTSTNANSSSSSSSSAQLLPVKKEEMVEMKPDVSSIKLESSSSSSVKLEGGDESGSNKRKAGDPPGQLSSPSAKKPKADLPSSLLSLAASEGITEEAVMKYLLRKPMTIAELLQKFKPKKSKISSNDLVPVIAHILKKLNPAKRNQHNKMYFFLNKIVENNYRLRLKNRRKRQRRSNFCPREITNVF